MARTPDPPLDVLLLFRTAPPEGLGVGEIAAALDLYRSRVHRTLARLAACGLVRQDPDSRRYHPGYAALELAGGLLAASELARAALPELDRLAAACGARVVLWVGDGACRVCLAATGEGLARLGQRLPLLPGAAGQVLLAFADPVTRAGLLGALGGDSGGASGGAGAATGSAGGAGAPGLAGGADASLFDPRALASELEQVRRQGWAAAPGEVAAPLFRRRLLAGALAVEGLAAEAAARCVPLLLAAATAASQ